jgi:hypothetical protein
MRAPGVTLLNSPLCQPLSEVLMIESVTLNKPLSFSGCGVVGKSSGRLGRLRN